MGLSGRAYAKHRGVSHTAIQKALRAGRIPAGPDGTIDPAVADAAWNAAGARGDGRPADAPRAVLRPGQVEAAEQLVRDVLGDHDVSPTGAALELADVRLANELLKAERQDVALTKERSWLRIHYGVSIDQPGPPSGHPALDADRWRAWATRAAGRLARALGLRAAEVKAQLRVLLDEHLAALGLRGYADITSEDLAKEIDDLLEEVP